MARAKNDFRIYWKNVGPAIYGAPQSRQAVGSLGNEMALSARSNAAGAAANSSGDRGGKMAAATSLRLKDVKPFFSPAARRFTRSQSRVEIPVALVVADHPSSSRLENEEGHPVEKAGFDVASGQGRWFKPAKKKRGKR